MHLTFCGQSQTEYFSLKRRPEAQFWMARVLKFWQVQNWLKQRTAKQGMSRQETMRNMHGRRPHSTDHSSMPVVTVAAIQ